MERNSAYGMELFCSPPLTVIHATFQNAAPGVQVFPHPPATRTETAKTTPCSRKHGLDAQSLLPAWEQNVEPCIITNDKHQRDS